MSTHANHVSTVGAQRRGMISEHGGAKVTRLPVGEITKSHNVR